MREEARLRSLMEMMNACCPERPAPRFASHAVANSPKRSPGTLCCPDTSIAVGGAILYLTAQGYSHLRTLGGTLPCRYGVA